MAPKKVMVFLLEEHQEYQQFLAEEACLVGKRHGLEVQVVWARNSPTAQLRDIMQAVSTTGSARPAAVIVEPAAAAGYDGAATEAAEAGVGWVQLTDRPAALERLQEKFPGRLIASVGADHDEIGRLQARLFRTLLPAGGRLVYVEGPSLSFAVLHRRNAMERGLPSSGFHIVKVLSGDWTGASAEKAATFWLKLGAKTERPALVGCQNDEMALGVRRAFLALRPDWEDVLYTGVDGLPQGGQLAVRQGLLAATIVVPPPTGPAVELVARVLRGEPFPPYLLIPPHPHPSLEDLLNRTAGLRI
jgi:ABC-type sugar transport system substrate-binding protein